MEIHTAFIISWQELNVQIPSANCVLNTTCLPSAVFWWWFSIPWYIYWIKASLSETTRIWCLLWGLSNGEESWRPKPHLRERKGEQSWTSFCSAASWAPSGLGEDQSRSLHTSLQGLSALDQTGEIWQVSACRAEEAPGRHLLSPAPGAWVRRAPCCPGTCQHLPPASHQENHLERHELTWFQWECLHWLGWARLYRSAPVSRE